MSNAYPRDIAVRVLTRVLSDHQPLDEALAGISGEVRGEARGWLQEICSGTLRWKGRLDFIIDSNALKKKPSGWLRKVLLIGVYQLVVQERVQPSSVVFETVAEVKRKEGEAPAKFANALLRKVADHALSWRNLEFPEKAQVEQQSAWGSMPTWLWKRLEKDHGRDWARAYALASFERPVLWLRAKNEEQVKTFTSSGEVPSSFKVDGETPSGPVINWPGFKEGDFFVQDISSQKLVSEVSRLVKESISGKVSALDLCAAPGGKSVGLAWNGFQVTASDRDEPRYVLLKQTVERVAPEVQIVPKSEVEALPEQDLVWVDAPCSGSGILRRHPDVRWLRDERELKSLGDVQEAVLKEGWAKVRPGGFLAYSVCSVLKDEGPHLIERAALSKFRQKHWLLVPQSEPFGDGFWCALLQKPI